MFSYFRMILKGHSNSQANGIQKQIVKTKYNFSTRLSNLWYRSNQT